MCQDMNTFRIALANIRFPATPEESVALAEQAIREASTEGADLICFPECFVPDTGDWGSRYRRRTRSFSNARGLR